MANLNTDLLSPEQAIEATVAAYNSKDAVEKIEGLEASASEINRSVNKTYNFVIGDDLYNATTGNEFLNITGWLPQTIGGTTPIFDNTSTFHKFNTLSMRIGEASSGNTSMFSKKTNLSAPIDFSNNDLITIWVYVDGDLVQDLSSASAYGAVILVAGDLNFANSLATNICGINGGNWHKGWNNVTVVKSDFSTVVSGSFDWSNLQSFQIRIDPAVASVGTLFHFDSIFLGGDTNYKIPVCITLDDSAKDSYEMAKIMNRYGIVVSSFVIPNFIDNTGLHPSSLNLEQIKKMYEHGNHIGLHHEDVNAFALNKELMLEVKNWLVDNGFTRDDGHLYGSYPNGSFNQNSIDYAKSIGIKGLRTLNAIPRNDVQGREASTGSIHYEAIANGGIADVYKVNSVKPINVADFTSKLNVAINKRAGFLTYHHLFSEFINRTEWEALAVYLKSLIDNGTIECLTFPQFCKKYSI